MSSTFHVLWNDSYNSNFQILLSLHPLCLLNHAWIWDWQIFFRNTYDRTRSMFYLLQDHSWIFITFPFCPHETGPKGILLWPHKTLVHQRDLRGVVFGVDLKEQCIFQESQKVAVHWTKNLIEWWTVGNFTRTSFALLFSQVFPEVLSIPIGLNSFGKFTGDNCVGKATSCPQFSICDSELLGGTWDHFILFGFNHFSLWTQIWWTSPDQNHPSYLRECHFDLKKPSNTPQMTFWDLFQIDSVTDRQGWQLYWRTLCIKLQLEFANCPHCQSLHALPKAKHCSSSCPGGMRSDLYSVR